jgi:hypothetical protein
MATSTSNFGGQGGCFYQGSYQLRKVYILEAEPVDREPPR